MSHDNPTPAAGPPDDSNTAHGQEADFRTLADNIPQLAWMADATGSIFWYNRRWYDYTGTTFEEMAGWGWQSVHDPAELPRVLERFRAHLASGEPWEDTFPLRGRDGRFRWHLSRAMPVRDDSGRVVRWFGTNTDITEQRALAAELRASEERVRLAVSAAGVGYWAWNLRDDSIRLDDRCAELFGLPLDPSLADVLARIAPEHRAAVEESLRAALDGRGPYRAEFRVIVPDVGDRWLTGLGDVVREPDGRPTQVAGVNIDVTEHRRAEERLRESERRFRLMADSIDQMIWVTRPDGFHEYYNRRWYEYTGVPEGSTDGEAWNGMFHPDDQQRAWNRWRRSLATGEPYEIEYRLRRNDGQYRWTLGRALPVRDSEGRIVHWFGTCTDIHDQKLAAEERERLLRDAERARDEAEAANRMKDEFLATLSHELRTPLNAIIGWTRLLRSNGLNDSERAEGLEVIDRNARAQAQLIDDLLDVSRIISGKMALDVQRVDLVEVIEAALAAVAPAAQAKGIRLQRVLDSLAGPVSGDPTRLQQVVWNLLSNAVKFTPKGGRVQVLLERVNSHVEISVIDDGIGIRPEFLPHVFDRFRQADGSTTRRHGGLGLGLSIVKQLVEMHGGSVRVKSPGENRGATFVVALPITVVHPEPDPPPASQSPGRADAEELCREGILDGLRVLVVDDERDARDLMRRVLEDCGAAVDLAESAEEALAAIARKRPEILISDVGMPARDGYELIGRVREEHSARELPAAALTAFARPEDRMRALLAGFQVHLGKPVDPDELVAVVAALAGRTGGQMPARFDRPRPRS